MKTRGKSVREVLELLKELGVRTEGVESAWLKSEVNMPACVVGLVEGGCHGCEKRGGLYLQCSKRVKSENLCGSCGNSCLTENRPKNGLYSERLNPSSERFTDGVWRTEEGKEALSWHQYLLNIGLNRKDGEEILRKKEINSLPDKEWEVKSKKQRGRKRTVSDSSSEENETSRFIPKDGKRKSPPKGESHKGLNGAMLRVYVCKETREVRKGNPSNWTEEANIKFTEMYCNSDPEITQGKDFGRVSKKKKNAAAQDQLAELQARLAAAEARALAAESKQLPTAPQVAAPEIPSTADKKKKMDALIKAKKKKKSDIEKKKEESKRQQEILMAQLAELKAEEVSDLEESDVEQELGNFEDSDDDSDDDESEEGQEFNPFEHDGAKYHRDEKDNLYTEVGEFWGHVTTEGIAVEGERN